MQCGFCTPGFVVAAVDLLDRVSDPSEDEVREALSGNICRCTGYAKILDAVRSAAEQAMTTRTHLPLGRADRARSGASTPSRRRPASSRTRAT